MKRFEVSHDRCARVARLLRRVLAAAGLLGLGLTAHAAGSNVYPNGGASISLSNGVATVGEPGSGGVPVSFLDRVVAASTSSPLDAVVTETEAATLMGTPVTFKVARAVTASEIAAGVAAVGAAAYGGCAVGTLINQYAFGGGGGAHGARITCNVTDWLADDGQPSTPGTMWTAGTISAPAAQRGQGSTGGEACAAYVAKGSTVTGTPPNTISSNLVMDSVSESPPSCYVHLVQVSCSATGCSTSKLVSHDAGLTSSIQQMCPASTDALNPAYNVKQGSPPGPDGKCPTGRYNAITPADAASRLAAYADKAQDVAVLKDLLDRAAQGSNQAVPIADTRHVTSPTPTTVQGSPTTSTTTNPDGTTSTTTTTPTYSFVTNNDNSIHITEGSTTTTTNGSTGQTTTTTTSAPAEDAKDPCEIDPARLGCIHLGDAPGDQVPKSSKTVTYTAESLNLPSMCPAPIALPHGNVLSYDTMCDSAVKVAPLIEAMGALIAAGIMVAALRAS